MAQLPLEQAIPRFKENEDRIDILVNANSTTSYVTSDNVSVPSFSKFILDKSTEIDVYIDSIVVDAEAARDAAEAFVEQGNTYVTAAEAAANAAQTAQTATEEARDQTLAVAANPEDFATAAQGLLADSALQPEDVGTAAAQNVAYFATAAQGTLADSAVQPEDLGTAAYQNVVYFANATSLTTTNESITALANTTNVRITATESDIGDLETDLTALANTVDVRVIRKDAAQSVTQDDRGFFANNFGGIWEPIGDIIDISSPVASVVWDNLDDYEELLLRGMDISSSNSAWLYVNVSADNGNTWISGANTYRVQGMTSGTGNTAASYRFNELGGLVSYWTFGTDVDGDNPVSIEANIKNFNKAKETSCVYNAIVYYAAGSQNQYLTHGSYVSRDNTAHNAIQLIIDPFYDISRGRLRLYGLRG